MSAASEPVVLIECPHCWHVIQRTVRDLQSTPGLWCETCANWAANSELRIVDVRQHDAERLRASLSPIAAARAANGRTPTFLTRRGRCCWRAWRGYQSGARAFAAVRIGRQVSQHDDLSIRD